jgi:ElaA protein
MNLKVKNFEELTKTELYEILKARAQVFIVENNMRCQDMDGIDFYCQHFFLEENGKILAYLRAIPKDDSTVKIGRVLSITHGIGLGRKLIEKSVDYIKVNTKYNKIFLNSQSQAVGFYEKLGFKVASDEFLEEGVVHLSMELEIQA